MMQIVALSLGLAGALAWQGASAAPAVPTAPVPARSRGFGAVVEVTLRVVPVVVRDATGRVPEDLTRDNFSLFEDGVAREVAFADFVRTGTPVKVHGEPGAARTFSEPEVGARRFVFVIDMMNPGSLRVQTRALSDLARFVRETMSAEDQAAVVTLAPHGTTASEFMPPGVRLAAAIAAIRPDAATVGKRTGQTRDSSSPTPRVLRRDPSLGVAEAVANADRPLATTSDGWSLWQESLDNQAVGLAVELEARTSGVRWLKAMAALARAVGAIPGRKIVLVYSAGLSAQGMHLDPVLRAAWQETRRRLADAGATVYALETGGLQEGPSLLPDPRIEFPLKRSRFDDQSGLLMVADATGGQLFHDIEHFDLAIDTIVSRESGYYKLAYYPSPSAAGREFHRLRVKVDRRGLEVWAPWGQLSRKPFAARDPIEHEAELIRAVEAETRSLDLVATARLDAFAGRDGRTLEVLTLRMPADQLMIADATPPQPGSARMGDALDLLLAARDRTGGYALWGRERLGWDALSEVVARGGWVYQRAVALDPARSPRLHVVLRENQTGRLYAAVLDVPNPDWSCERLSPPVRIESSPGGAVSRHRGPRDPFDFDGLRLVPAEASAPAAEAASFYFEVYGVGDAGLPALNYEIADAEELRDLGPEGVAGEGSVARVKELVILDRAARTARILAQLPLEGVAAGAHTLRVSVRGEARSVVGAFTVGPATSP